MVANRNYGTDAAQGERATDIVADPSNVFGAGSSFKIFTTAAALESGTVGLRLDAAQPGDRTASPRRTPTGTPPATRWPTTDELPDPISLQDALATSPNVAFVGLEARTGLPAVVQMAQRLGLRDTLASNDAGGDPGHRPGRPAVAQTRSTTSRSRSTSRTCSRSPSASAR